MKIDSKSLYDMYFKEFGESQKPMAASLEALIYCEKIIDSSDVSTILDSGSGVSSVFFHSKYKNVSTIDDDPYWAKKTKSFIIENINKDIDIEPISSIKDKKFDFVFYDYGNMETRIFYFKTALNMCKGIFYIDDMHVLYYREYVKSRCQNYQIQLLPETTDQYGRFGALIVK